MAGHRKGTGRPRRCDSRADEHMRRVREAPTGRAQVSAAFDWWRSAAVRHPDADTVLHELATRLATEARELERRAAA